MLKNSPLGSQGGRLDVIQPVNLPVGDSPGRRDACDPRGAGWM